MSMPYVLPPPPPAMFPSPPMTPQSHTTNTQGSIGAVTGVLAVVLILGILAVLIGRLCSGRGIMGRAHYDMESWVEAKCSSCVDGRVVLARPPPSASPPPHPPTTSNEAAGEGTSASNVVLEDSPEVAATS